MREILFRGKRYDNCEFAEGFYHFSHWYLPPSMKIIDTHYYILPIGGGDAFQIAPETVGQYTGLTDKNGRKIFEGDILRERGSLFLVVYDQAWARFKLQSIGRGIQYPEFNRGVQMEIVGNIHDNPELLEG